MFDDDTSGDTIHQNYFSHRDKTKTKALVICTLTAYRRNQEL